MFLVISEKLHDQNAVEVEKEIAASLGELSAADRKLAQAQRFCTMMEYSRLGAMGKPVKVMIEGKPRPQQSWYLGEIGVSGNCEICFAA
ncbi:MAG: hypothetical protein WKF77_19270 [Planctomycetaceae bacterium]